MARPWLMPGIVVGIAALVAGPAGAKDGVTAGFIDGTFATPHECKKLRAVEAGGSRNVATAPELLTSKGFLGWENWCSFGSIKAAGNGYIAKMNCGEGAEEWTDTYRFKRRGVNAIDVTVKGKTTRHVRCEPKTKG